MRLGVAEKREKKRSAVSGSREGTKGKVPKEWPANRRKESNRILPS